VYLSTKVFFSLLKKLEKQRKLGLRQALVTLLRIKKVILYFSLKKYRIITVYKS